MNYIRYYRPLLIILALPGVTSSAAADSFGVDPSATHSASLDTAVQPGASDTYDPEPVIASHGAPLPCLTRLKNFVGVHFILIGARDDGVDANFARGWFVQTQDFSLAQFDSVHNQWLFASRRTCEHHTGGPDGFSGCAVDQPFTVREPSYLEVSLREDGQLVLADGNVPWSSFLNGQCMGDMLYAYNGLDMWTLSFSDHPTPEIPR